MPVAGVEQSWSVVAAAAAAATAAGTKQIWRLKETGNYPNKSRDTHPVGCL